MPAEVIAACRARSMENICLLIRFADHKKSQTDPEWASIALRAISALMDRGWGTAPQTVKFEGDTTTTVLFSEKIDD